MRWSPQQNKALRAVERWDRRSQQIFRLFGYAGTGKTELARHFAINVSGTVLFVALTGKAASVLRERGCPNAQGSQWPEIVLYNESSTFGKDARRWLYTGITRAMENITVVNVERQLLCEKKREAK
jgi:hypothetical protein